MAVRPACECLSPCGGAVSSGLTRGHRHSSPGRHVVILEVTFSPTREPIGFRTGPPQAKRLMGGSRALPISRQLDYRFTEHGPAHQSKTQFSPQLVPPIRKLAQASYQRADRSSKNYNPTASRTKTTITEANQKDHMNHSFV